LAQVQGLIAAIPVKDTIKIVAEAGGADPASRLIESTPDRHRLWAAQTPQGFELQPLFEAHSKAAQSGWEVTDDAALFEKMGLSVAIVAGEETNLKITTPLDMIIAAHLLTERLRSSG
jgi:2-C-methyl-D-erythritol 4-phosphate cytidylyltransferase